MSATIADDSAIVRTFEAEQASVAEPLTSNSLAGVSERMILVPELMSFAVRANLTQTMHDLARWAATEQDAGTVILVPSHAAAQAWADEATVGITDTAAACIRELQEGRSRGPFVFANRYDAIDLPGQACRLLILTGPPRGASEYDLYRADVLEGGAAINSTFARRIEQGIGRGARSAGDCCAVILLGRDLVTWMSRATNERYLTSSTRAQLRMGEEVSQAIGDTAARIDTIQRLFRRDRDWVECHAATLADLAATDPVDVQALALASAERRAFRLWRDGYPEKAAAHLADTVANETGLDPHSNGRLLEFAARIAYAHGRKEQAQRWQQEAYAFNRNVLRPQSRLAASSVVLPGPQATAIVAGVEQFAMRRGYLAHFDEVTSLLTPEATSGQFRTDTGGFLGHCSASPPSDPKRLMARALTCSGCSQTRWASSSKRRVAGARRMR